jgi:hypothetical protein
MIVSYKAYDGSNGLQVKDDTLYAWVDGKKVGEVALDKSEDLETLLLTYKVPALLPDLQFSLSGKEEEIDIELEINFQLGKSLFGTASFQDAVGFWEAERVGSETLARGHVPDGERPWVEEEENGFGWEITLPRLLMENPDPVIRKRAALSIEAMIYFIAAGRRIPLPYGRRISNVFSAKEPMWPDNIPLVSRGEY